MGNGLFTVPENIMQIIFYQKKCSLQFTDHFWFPIKRRTDYANQVLRKYNKIMLLSVCNYPRTVHHSQDIAVLPWNDCRWYFYIIHNNIIMTFYFRNRLLDLYRIVYYKKRLCFAGTYLRNSVSMLCHWPRVERKSEQVYLQTYF